MMKNSTRIILSLLGMLLLMLIAVVPAQAIDDPDSPPSINAVYVFEFDGGSVGILIDYYLDYAVLPTETATDSYFGVFVDTDGTTQLKAVAPYTFVDSGYGRGLIWIPFTAAEVIAYGIDSADVADYRIWLTGNPTLTWAPGPDPPKTIALIDQWQNTGDMSVLLALRILYYADVLELAWSLDMVEVTAMGNKLTTVGASYFENVINGCRVLAPAAFADSTSGPDAVDISYDTAFGATAASGTATIVGSPVTLVAGSNTINTGATTGTIVLTLAQYTSGTVTNGTGTVTGSPVTISPGINTLTVTAAGTFTVVVNVTDTATQLNTSVTGTGFDMTTLATRFGMSRWMFSGIIWVLITVILCAAAFATTKKSSAFGDAPGATKIVMILATLSLIGGTLLGLLHPLVSAMLFIAFGAIIGYVFFFRSEALHKGFMFMLWMFFIVSIAGNMAASGQSGVTTTRLTASITATEATSIAVTSTVGFPSAGSIVIDDEQILYGSKNNTHFLGTAFNPIVRGAGGTDASIHTNGTAARTKESYALNAGIDYKIARLADSAGVLGYIAAPVRLLDLILTFFKLPLEFLGTDMAILAYIWMVVAVGMVIGFVVAMIGVRRV